MDINIALIKHHNDNSTNKMYNEIEFCYKRHWEFVDNNFVVFRWELDSPKPTYDDLKKYSTDEITELKNFMDEIMLMKRNTVLITDNKELLKDHAVNGSIIFEPKTKKLFVFNNEWVRC